jgi:NAD(P)-dependent dehydrogenase (short-subunit alcohol dehydrogenase family)
MNKAVLGRREVVMTILDAFRLDGRIAVVTGGAGKYGRQIVEALGEAGAKVYMASRNLEKLEEQAQAFRDAGLDVQARQLDQAKEDSVLALRDAVLEEAGRVDVLVNNAVSRPMADWSGPVEEFEESMQVNMTGIFIMTRAFGDVMEQQHSGSIINIGSTMGVIAPDYTLYEGLGWGMPADYFVHKGGMIMLTRFAASKYGPAGVRVNCINPGGFFANQDERFVERYNARTFLGRMANDTDLKGIIVLLASDASAYITGEEIAVDGGYTKK